MRTLAIIGGGASGMLAGITALRQIQTFRSLSLIRRIFLERKFCLLEMGAVI